jgi:hypothetical protein
MGCIVNGPGEMADADFGYVGSGPGKIDLYVGHERVERNVPQAEAVDRLVGLIRSRGLWSKRTPKSERTVSYQTTSSASGGSHAIPSKSRPCRDRRRCAVRRVGILLKELAIGAQAPEFKLKNVDGKD